MTSRSLVIAVVLVFAGLLNAAHAEDYGVNDSSAVDSGVNFDPRDLSRAYPRCMLFGSEVQLSAANPANPLSVAILFTAKEVTSRQHLYKELHKSVSASGHYGIFKAGGSYSEDSMYNFDDDSLTVLVKGEVDYGMWDKSEAKLHPEYVKMLGDGSPKKVGAFVETCGLEFIQRTRRGIMAALVFQFRNLSEEKRRKITATLKGGVQSSTWGAEVQGAYESFTKEASLNTQLAVTVHAIGGPGRELLGPLVANYRNVELVRSMMDTFFSNATIAQAAPTGYTSALLASYSGGKLPGTDLSDYLRYLGTVWLSMADLQSRADRANSDVRNAEDFPLTMAEIESLHVYTGQIRSQLDLLAKRAEKCKDAYGKFNGKNRDTVRVQVASACQLDSKELEVSSYPIGMYRERRPVKIEYFINSFLTDPTKKLLVAKVSGHTVSKVYFRVPGPPALNFEQLKSVSDGQGKLFKGALELKPAWTSVDIVAEVASGTVYVESVLVPTSVGLVTTPALATQKLGVQGPAATSLRKVEEF